ncbi:hypothetical protein NQT69_13625 [Pseudoalteromonas shioyasakiensis]|uniref:hypothetical protein n=1 Tax=Pseudoalteromonas shioyasakiensis TaxID=1190813 RepID=UPI0021190B67|nr:hypothetical protein [Pseudoalteromonas shioyasakiensis]MCQ8879045.1 hypothetical protein [Pseudoalteromonas shioyasakiensis]
MMKNSLLSLLLAFIAGAALASGYFLFTEPTSSQPLTGLEHIQSTSKVPRQTVEVAQITTLSATKTAKPQVDMQKNTDTAASNEQLEQQVKELKQALAVQQAAVKRYQKQLQAPSDFEQVLLDKFAEQARDEDWAYRTEAALQDFLLTADLTVTPELVSAECKTSVCKFELAAPEGEEEFDHTQWRELNDKLVKQAFWQQFKTSTSTSSDTDFKLLLSTEQ